MPVLNWIGKDAVVAHDTQVPFRLLHDVPELACPPQAAEHASFPPLPLAGEGRGEGGDNSTGNLIVEGDNLLALKALLPHYGGQVKCIYIDPPYNTGNEGWVYNDNVNSPQMREWLGKVVGKEAEDLTRHDKWLCMMYPRLKLLKRFLREDGAIFVSIDDIEIAKLRLLMDEIFGAQNFVATVVWQKKYAVSNDHKTIAPMHDFVLVYQRSEAWRRNLLPRGEEKDAQYKYEDEKGVFRNSDYTCNKTAEERPNLYYAITNPNTGNEIWPKRTRVWAYSEVEHHRHIAEGLVYWGKNGKGKVPAYKRYKHALKNSDGVVPQTLWQHEFAGHTDSARKELREILHDVPSVSDFATPKPTLLIQRILQIASDQDSLILDSFAGSGTTAHAVLKQNAEDGGNRRFILVEMDPKIARNVTAERVRRVAQGYRKGNNTLTPTPLPQAGEGSDWVAGLGGGFRYATLGKPLFAANGHINPEVTFSELARFVWFMETGVPWADEPPSPQPSPASGRGGKALSPLLGVHAGRAVYLLYNGILKDKSAGGGNVLTSPLLAELPPHAGPKTIYGARCLIKPERLRAMRIAFKQLPYELKVAR